MDGLDACRHDASSPDRPTRSVLLRSYAVSAEVTVSAEDAVKGSPKEPRGDGFRSR